MNDPRISKQTADLATSLLQSMSKQGVLPASEANAASAILRDASRTARPDARCKEAGSKSRLLTTAEAASRLACSKKTVLRMASDKLLTRRYLRPGNSKSLRFVEAEIDALCASAVVED